MIGPEVRTDKEVTLAELRPAQFFQRQTARPTWSAYTNCGSSQLAYCTNEYIGQVLGLSKQRGQQMVAAAIGQFRRAWFRLHGEDISERQAKVALASAACHEPTRQVPAYSDEFLTVFCTEWLADTGENISPSEAEDLLRSAY